MQFQVSNSIIFKALENKPYLFLALALKKLSFSTLILSSFFVVLGFGIGFLPGTVLSKLLGLALISLALFLTASLQELFYNTWLLNPKIRWSLKHVLKDPEKFNLADFFDLELAQAIYAGEKFCKKRKLPFGTSVLFYFLLGTQTAKFIFLRLGLNLENIASRALSSFENYPQHLDLKHPFYTLELKDTLKEVLNNAVQKNKNKLSSADFLSVLAKKDPYFKEVLIENQIKSEDVASLGSLKERLEDLAQRRRKFWSKENLALFGAIGRDLASGYTITLDLYSKDLTNETLKGTPLRLVGHQTELKEISRILTLTQNNNVLLVGRPGSGRREIIRHFARESYFGNLPELLNYKRFVELDLPALISRLESLEVAEMVLDKVFTEAREAKNVILIINDLHNYVSQVQKPGILDISGILSSHLSRPGLQVIALTTFVGFHQELMKNPSLLNYFNKVEVKELSEQETLEVLEDLMAYFENRHKKIITLQALRAIVELSAKYLQDKAFPKKAIELLDEVMVYASSKPHHPFVLPEDVQEVITQKTEIPVGKIQKKEKDILLNLENLIHQRIVNQEEAVIEISNALRRARTEVTIRKGPIGAFLFLGPTGVGKTETSKALAEIYFGSENRMIRLDMSEFQNVQDIPRLIGGDDQEGILTTQVRENPFSLLLLDEIEKAHQNILNLFLQVLDEGHITDGFGRKVSFKNTLIIATSNAGAQIIWEDVRQDKKLDIIKEDLFSYLFEKNLFRPEFLNRFDAVVIFKPLSKQNLLEIADLLFGALVKILAQKEIELKVSPQVKEKIVELGYNPAFGAREMRRVIQEKVENLIALALLEGKIKPGDKVNVYLSEKGEFLITKTNSLRFSSASLIQTIS